MLTVVTMLHKAIASTAPNKDEKIELVDFLFSSENNPAVVGKSGEKTYDLAAKYI